MDEKAVLRQEVERLQAKLHQLHATDTNTLRRSYASIAQHVEALKAEAARLEELVRQLEPDIYTPDYVASELGRAAAVGSASWALYKLARTTLPLPPKAAAWLRSSLLAVTAFVIIGRFASSSIGRFASAFFDHRRRKKQFLQEMAELQQRIDILQALTRSLPHALSQGNLPALAAAGAAAGQHEGGGNGGNNGGSSFVVVDLPRVESGGFASPMASPAPPGAAANLQQQLQQQQPGGASSSGAFMQQQHPAQQEQPVQQPAQQQQEQEQQPGGPMRSAFHMPASVAGWGGVVQQQQGWRPPSGSGGGEEQQQHQQQPGALGPEAGAALPRQPSGGDEGVLIEQPLPASTSAGQAGSSSRGGTGVRASPAASSSSDDIVLLERDPSGGQAQ